MGSGEPLAMGAGARESATGAWRTSMGTPGAVSGPACARAGPKVPIRPAAVGAPADSGPMALVTPGNLLFVLP